jgi:rubrerythrin
MAKLIRDVNDLASTHPEIAKEWHPTKNGELTPSGVTYGSRRKIWWLCPIVHAYEQSVNRRILRGSACPYCSGHKVLTGFNDLATINPELAAEWHPTKNGDLTPFVVTAGTAKRVWWQCPLGHEYQATVHDRNSDHTKCPICNARKQTSFPEQAIYYYIKKLYPDTISKYKEVFANSMELDVYVPSIRFAVEFDGAAWHNTEAQHERERQKYEICKDNVITLFRVKEHTGKECMDVADATYNIKKIRRASFDELEAVIHAILDSIDIESNMWTRKNPLHFHCNKVDVNIPRDRAEIQNYVFQIENSFTDIRPDVAKKWNFDRNGSLNPNMFSVGSNEIVWWKCPDCGHEWQSSINSMTREGRRGCAICSKKQRGNTFTKGVVEKVGSLSETMPELAKEWHPIKNGTLTPNDITAGRFQPVWWLCPKCGYEWQASPNNRKKGVGCPCCSGRVPKTGINDLATLYPKLLLEWDYEKNIGTNPEMLLPGSGKKVWWKCSVCGHEWATAIVNRTKGHNCPKCVHKRRT